MMKWNDDKICILGDTHFGARGDSLEFHRYYERFYSKVFFPYLKENNIKVVIQVGDLYDRRKFININTLFLSRSYFYNLFGEYDIQLISLLGNHDIYFKNTLDINSPELLLGSIPNVHIFKDYGQIDFNGVLVDVIPWMCESNVNNIKYMIRQSKAHICVGHFEINGFQMNRGSVFKGDFKASELSKYEIVISGHFHHRSNDNHIFYVGTPTENTWADHNDPKGFHILDLNTRELSFIQNPYTMFNKIVYDDSEYDSDYWNCFDFDKYQDTYVKIIVACKNDPFLLDTVIDRFDKAGVCDLSVIEDFSSIIKDEEDDVDQTEDTVTILNKWIDNQDLSVDRYEMKKLMNQMYIEALNVRNNE